MERLFGPLRGEEWQGREKEVAARILRDLREGLKGYPGILEHIGSALDEPLGQPAVPRQGAVPNHLVGELSGPGCLNSRHCGPS
jgi:hypothetical protein